MPAFSSRCALHADQEGSGLRDPDGRARRTRIHATFCRRSPWPHPPCVGECHQPGERQRAAGRRQGVPRCARSRCAGQFAGGLFGAAAGANRADFDIRTIDPASPFLCSTPLEAEYANNSSASFRAKVGRVGRPCRPCVYPRRGARAERRLFYPLLGRCRSCAASATRGCGARAGMATASSGPSCTATWRPSCWCGPGGADPSEAITLPLPHLLSPLPRTHPPLSCLGLHIFLVAKRCR